MRVLVTGATGFIGQHLCRHLDERGDEVIALVRNSAKASVLPAGVRTLTGDLSLFADPGTELPPCDVVVHLAGVVAAERMEDYHRINYVAVRDLVECLRRQRWSPRRLVFASSLAAAGPSPADRPWTEDDPLCPIDAYGEAKAEAERLLRDAPFPTTSFRPPLVFGPKDEATLTLFRSARAGIGMRVAGPAQRLSFVDVRDLVDAITKMADDERPGARVYYPSHPATMDTQALWRALSRAVGRRVVVLPIPRTLLYVAMRVSTLLSKVLRYRNQLDAKQYAQMTAPGFVCSGHRLTDELDWRPQHELEDCIAHAAEGYRRADMLRPSAGRPNAQLSR
jgi:nucleoside-diphosphate-sugar epimerase